MIEQRSAAQCPPGSLVLTQKRVAIVTGRGEPPADAQDQTPTVTALVVTDDGYGEEAVLGGVETVTWLGRLKVSTLPIASMFLSVNNEE